MSEEKKIILEMLKEGKISVEEAEQLLEKANPGETFDETPKIKKPKPTIKPWRIPTITCP